MWIYTKPSAYTKLSQCKFELEFGLDNGLVYRSWSNNLYFYIKSLFYVIDNYINKKKLIMKINKSLENKFGQKLLIFVNSLSHKVKKSF